MTAAAMFSELGFYLVCEPGMIRYVFRSNQLCGHIVFYVETKEYKVWTTQSSTGPRYGNMVCPEWHMAITKQLEELGWI